MIYVTADLHFGLNAQGDSATRKMAEYLTKKTSRGDVICLAGDIGSDDDSIARCLRLLKHAPAAKLVLPGNHDVWTDGQDSWERYQRFAGLAKEHGFCPLHQEPYINGSLGIIGSMGWYDYSFLDVKGADPRDAKTNLWNDTHYVHWDWEDSLLARHLGELLRRQADAILACKERLVITHHLPTSKLLFQPRWIMPRHWRLANTFLGSDFYSSLLSDLSPLDWVCGHSHMARRAAINDMRFYSVGSDYEKKELMIKANGEWKRLTFT